MSIHHTVLAFLALAVGTSAYSQEAAKRQMDLENAMMAVQMSRAEALERQLKAEMDAVSKRNKDIGILNNVLRAALQLRSELPNVAGPNAATPNGANKTMLANAFNEVGKTDRLQQMGGALTQMGALTYGTKAELDNSIAKVKFKIDELSGSQQMDMLRLQSLSNKRNEAFENATNFQNKMVESRSSIIKNMQGK